MAISEFPESTQARTRLLVPSGNREKDVDDDAVVIESDGDGRGISELIGQRRCS